MESRRLLKVVVLNIDIKCECSRDTTETKIWKKIQALNGIQTHDLRDTGAVLS